MAVSRCGRIALLVLTCSLVPIDGHAQVLYSFRSGFAGNPLYESWWIGSGGSLVEAAGDVDADGHADIIASLPTLFSPLVAGMVRVYSGRDGAILHQFEVFEQGFGGVASAGDVDGDERADLIVGSAYRVRVYSGATGALLMMKDELDKSIHEFGAAVASAGDLDGDGLDDVLVGASNSVWAYSVRDGALLLMLPSPAPGNTHFGFSVAGGLDLDGDGVPDVIVGAERDNEGGYGAGAVWVFSGATGAVLHKLHDKWAYEHVGSMVDTLGDVDGDGRCEVLAVSSPTVGSKVPRKTRVWSGATGALIHKVPASSPVASGMGDVDGDGIPDFTSGHRVRSGATGHLILGFPGAHPGGSLPVRAVGDVDGDGWPDVARKNIDQWPPRTTLDVLSVVVPVPHRGVVVTVGEGCAPPSGPPGPLRPVLGVTGRIVPGGTLALSLVGVAPQSLAIVVLGLAPDVVPMVNGCQLLVAAPWTLMLLPTQGVQVGWASQSFRLPDDLGTWPADVYVQAVTLDSSLFLGYSVSELVHVSLGGR